MTDIYGIFGYPVAHSLSPVMHARAFAALGIDAVYLRFAVAPERLGEAVSGMRALGLAGVNVTLPHKTAVMQHLDRIEPSALAIGAVNTIFRDGDLLCGDNTDADGLSEALREAGAKLQGARVLVLGAGGAARASVIGLARAGASHIDIAARRASEAQALCAALTAHAGKTVLQALDMSTAALAPAFARTDVLVQATSATLDGNASAATFADSLPMQALPTHALVTDLVYKPLQTVVLAAAQARGLRTLDGLGMLLHQGALSLRRWTGKAAPVTEMRAALLGR